MLIAAGISEQTEHDRYLTLACQAGTKAGCDELQREKDAQAAAAIAAQQAAQAAALKAEEDAKLQAQQEQERQRKEAEDRRQRAIREQREREEAERRAAEQEAAAKQAAIEGTANRRTSGFVLTAVGAGLGATSVVFMGLGAAKNSAIRGGGYANASAISSAASAGATFNKVAWVTGITGVIGITVGGGLVIFNPPPSTASSASAAGRLPGLSFVRSW
jgi:membrane protein involved in colicin uptake